MEKFHWQLAQVTKILQETATVKSFTLSLPQWQPHLPGQHYDVRLTAEDGYQAQRSYSIGSPPEDRGEITFTVERLEGGELSTYLHDSARVGDFMEVRGPIGGYFVWTQALSPVPLLLVAGGSGIVPLMAMLRHRQRVRAINPTLLLCSVRSEEDLIYRSELRQLAEHATAFQLHLAYTRKAPRGWSGYQRRIDREMMADALAFFDRLPQAFVCGPSGLVEKVATILVDLGLPENTVKTERFGPSS